jgi:signal transduction histidine kinase
MKLNGAVPLVALCALAGPLLAGGPKGTAEGAKALLDKAVKAVETDGEAKALAKFNDPKGPFVDRDLYVFCFGPDRKVTAHVDAKMLGTDTSTIKDPEGKAIGKDMVALGEKGEGTVEYKWKNPASGNVETKVSFLKRAGAQVCGVGAYK